MKRMHAIALGALAMLTLCAMPVLAQGLPGATVRPDAGSGATSGSNDGRDTDKASLRERCKANLRQCEEMKAKMQERRAQCKADPEKCRAEFRARMEERCKANPQRCAEMKAKMQERRAQCKADPEKCRAEFKARMEERCKANPQRCEEAKARFKERQEQCKADPDRCRPGQDRRPDGKQ